MSALNIDGTPRPLGRTELSSFPIAYGCWRFAGTDVQTAREKVEAALEYGIDLFDHADVYGCDGGGEFGDAEILFGKVLAEAPALRDRMTIATKGGIVLGVPYDSSATYLRSAVEASLRRLQIEVIDLYQIHRPDFLGHPEEIASVLTALRDEGKIREVGVSNYTPSQFSALQAWLPFPIATRQPEFSCWQHDAIRNGILDQCLEHKGPRWHGALCRWTLGSDCRCGSRAAGWRAPRRFAERARPNRHGSECQSLGGCAGLDSGASGRRNPIIGTQTISRIKESVSAVNVELTRTDWNQILVAAQGEPLP